MNRQSSTSKLFLEHPWTKTKEDVAHFYKVDETQGLSEERVAQDLGTYGPNGKLQKKLTKHCLIKVIFFGFKNCQVKKANHYGNLF